MDSPDFSTDRLLQRLHGLVDRLEAILPTASHSPAQPVQLDASATLAFRYRRRPGATSVVAQMQPVVKVASIGYDDLQGIDTQKERFARNLAQFVQGLPANHVLLSGARGTGKSSLVRAGLMAHQAQGLRLIEVDKTDLIDLPDLVDAVSGLPQRFVVFCDDLSFDEGESGYKALKSILDGTVSAMGDNVLIVATSNRRHLLPEYHSDNKGYRHTPDGELHPGEVVEEKISLSERFGLWLSFYPFTQDEYLTIVSQWLSHFGVAAAQHEAARPEALIWAIERGSRSGRIAYQFARDYAGQHAA